MQTLFIIVLSFLLVFILWGSFCHFNDQYFRKTLAPGKFCRVTIVGAKYRGVILEIKDGQALIRIVELNTSLWFNLDELYPTLINY